MGGEEEEECSERNIWDGAIYAVPLVILKKKREKDVGVGCSGRHGEDDVEREESSPTAWVR